MNRNVVTFLLLVVGLCGVIALTTRLMAIPTPNGSGVPVTRQVLDNVSGQLDVFQTHCGRYPTTEEGLAALLARPDSPGMQEKWLGPYLKAAVIDGWGNALCYQLDKSGQGFRLWSHGLDGVSDTEDDLAVSKP